jgi:iron complex outermembrane receptor protein
MRRTLLLIFILFTALSSFAQNTVTGKVTDEQTGAPISGASVTVKGEKAGVVTEADGSFSNRTTLYAKSLLISFVG